MFLFLRQILSSGFVCRLDSRLADNKTIVRRNVDKLSILFFSITTNEFDLAQEVCLIMVVIDFIEASTRLKHEMRFLFSTVTILFLSPQRPQ